MLNSSEQEGFRDFLRSESVNDGPLPERRDVRETRHGRPRKSQVDLTQITSKVRLRMECFRGRDVSFVLEV